MSYRLASIDRFHMMERREEHAEVQVAGRLQGKVALVTGAGSVGPGWGNGKATAVLFAREGAKVVALDLRAEAAEETRALIEREGGECLALAGDVSRDEDVARVVTQTIERFGSIDVLHNNVGTAVLGGPVEVSEADWDRIFAINVKSVFLTCKHVLPHMERQGKGSIVNVASIGAIRDIGVAYVAYAASKAAVIGTTKSVALQYAAKGIRCNVILPGLMDTPHIRGPMQAAYGGELDRMIADRAARSPTGRMGTGWDVAHAALYLASDEAAYVNAVELIVDGGITTTIR
jgi:NAD(P)-dependent dehydrogenase (short-subunit alcohol dehydrogenase family)